MFSHAAYHMDAVLGFIGLCVQIRVELSIPSLCHSMLHLTTTERLCYCYLPVLSPALGILPILVYPGRNRWLQQHLLLLLALHACVRASTQHSNSTARWLDVMQACWIHKCRLHIRSRPVDTQTISLVQMHFGLGQLTRAAQSLCRGLWEKLLVRHMHIPLLAGTRHHHLLLPRSALLLA